MSAIKVLVCVGPNCDANGRGRALFADAQAALAATFPVELADGRLELSTRDCLRLCTRDPVVRLEPSGDAFSNPDIDELLSLIAKALSSAKDRESFPSKVDRRSAP